MPFQRYSDGSTPSICVIGAGFGGLVAGIKLKSELGLKDFVIWDQNHDVGGVWLSNTYPGAGSDVPGHLFTYSFEPYPYFSHNFATQPEILAYLQNVARKYSLYENIQFHCEVKQILWDETCGVWRVTVFHKQELVTREHVFQIVLNSCGALRVPNVPEIFDKFEGPKFHSGKWDPTIELENKVVAVVGGGASAAQLIPEILPKVKTLHSYQRKPAWVLPKINFKFPKFVQWIFAHVPFILCLFRWTVFWLMEIFYNALVLGTKSRSLAKWYARRHFNRQISGKFPDLREKLSPKHPFGCTRTLISNSFLKGMTNPKVKVHIDPVVAVGSNSIETAMNGTTQIDVLILATGFRVQEYFAPMSIIGKGGINLLTYWIQERPTGYLGLVASIIPNQFGILGPHTGLGHNSAVFMMECQMTYIVAFISEMMRRDARVFEVNTSVETEEMEILDEQMDKMVWGKGACKGSWYTNGTGLNTTLWPWTCVAYWKRTRKPDFTKFTFHCNLTTSHENNNDAVKLKKPSDMVISIE